MCAWVCARVWCGGGGVCVCARKHCYQHCTKTKIHSQTHRHILQSTYFAGAKSFRLVAFVDGEAPLVTKSTRCHKYRRKAIRKRKRCHCIYIQHRVNCERKPPITPVDVNVSVCSCMSKSTRCTSCTFYCMPALKPWPHIRNTAAFLAILAAK